MNNRTVFVLAMLALLLVANILMIRGFTNYPASEGFVNYVLGAAPSSPQNGYEPIGTYDGLVKTPEHGMSKWRGPEPNVPLAGPEPGPNDMFLFENNQCKPGCCPASFSCSTGCVCTTTKQRALLQARGGNRTDPVNEIPFA